jgi:hypothetical protein
LFQAGAGGQAARMMGNILKGALAGLAGTTALNAATYVDMAVRARPASSTPEQAVEELAKRGGVTIPGEGEERENRLQGLGPLSGIATGVLVGAAAGQFSFVVRRLGPVLGPVLLGGAAMAATDGGLAKLGISDPGSWDATAWLSDAIPHLAFGAVTWAVLAGA